MTKPGAAGGLAVAFFSLLPVGTAREADPPSPQAPSSLLEPAWCVESDGPAPKNETARLTPGEVALVSLPPMAAVPARIIEHGRRESRLVALTFDACSTKPPMQLDQGVIDALVATNTPATLFLGGQWMLAHKEQVQQLAATGLFELGVHGFGHPHMQQLSASAIEEELMLCDQILYSLTGRRAELFRPPFGEFDDQVLRVAGALGIAAINFDLPSGDADPNVTKARMIPWVLEKTQGGSIVVMHMNGRGWHTAESLPELIESLRAKGLLLTTVGDLLRDEAQSQLASLAAYDPEPYELESRAPLAPVLSVARNTGAPELRAGISAEASKDVPSSR